MLDSMQIAVLSTLACFALLFIVYVKSVLGKAAKEQLEKEARSKQTTGNDDDSSNKAGKPRKVRFKSSMLFNVSFRGFDSALGFNEGIQGYWRSTLLNRT